MSTYKYRKISLDTMWSSFAVRISQKGHIVFSDWYFTISMCEKCDFYKTLSAVITATVTRSIFHTPTFYKVYEEMILLIILLFALNHKRWIDSHFENIIQYGVTKTVCIYPHKYIKQTKFEYDLVFSRYLQ